MTWKRTGGGCCLGCNKGFPCDDDFVNPETGECVVFYSTKEAHFAMPHTVETLIEIRDLDGVEDRVRIKDNRDTTGMEQDVSRP